MGHNAAPSEESSSQRRLTLFDATAIIVGIVIGSGIYETSPRIARFLAGDLYGGGFERLGIAGSDGALLAALLLLWGAGALVAWLGALCFAELSTAFPDHGGGYAYLSRAFGSRCGLAFAWAEFWVVRPGNIGTIAFVFARYLGDPLGFGLPPWVMAAGVVLLVTLLNALGFHAGRWSQNLLTSAKVLGLVAVVVLGLFVCPTPAGGSEIPGKLDEWQGPGIAVAFVLVMFAFGGWSDMPYVAAEVRDPRRNLGRALLLGSAVTALIYLLANLAFICGLGWGPFLAADGAKDTAAAQVVMRAGGSGSLINLLICVSCLSAVNGMIFTGGRLYYAVGRRHAVFSPLGAWSQGRGVPVASIWAQGIITAGLIAVFGLRKNEDSFTALVNFTGPFYWGFILLTVAALVVLRQTGRLPEDRFRTPLYPLTPLLFMLACGWMVQSSAIYAWNNRAWEMLWAVAVLASGVAVLSLDRPLRTDNAEIS